MKTKLSVVVLAALSWLSLPLSAQSLLHRVDSMLNARYHKGGIDTAYVTRPSQKWTVRARLNMSGAEIEAKGIDQGARFHSVIDADYKTTISLGVTYMGISLNASLNPSKVMGKYSDYEVNFNVYGKRFGFDFIYQDAKNFTGWHETDGQERIELPEDMLKVQTLNVNAYYAFNSRRFSYPAAFSQSYIQKRSAGSFLLAASGQGQKATLDWEEGMQLKITNIALGAGYGYNFVPGRGWLLHLSALPTFIVYSKTSMSFAGNSVPLKYHFPENIITGRGAVLYQWSNKFLGLSMVYNFTNDGDEDNLAIHNSKWRIRAFFGVRL